MYRTDQTKNAADRITETKRANDLKDLHVRMRTAENMWKAIPAYNPNDPRFQELTKALGDVNLPLTPKDAKKNVKQVQDSETGAWTLILTNPVDGSQEVRPITSKDGKQLVTTPSIQVSTAAAAERQGKQIGANAAQQELNRTQRQQIHDDVMKNGRDKTIARFQDAFVKEFQRANKGKLPTTQQIQEHLTNNVLPLIDPQQ